MGTQNQPLPQPQAMSITLNVDVQELFNSASFPASARFRSEAEIQQLTTQFARSALRSSNLQMFNMELFEHDVWLMFTVVPQTQEEQPEMTNRAGQRAQPPVARIDAASVKEIYADLEQAIKDYGLTTQLAANPLVEQLIINTDQANGKEDSYAGGAALQQLLDHAIDTICQLPVDAMLPQDAWLAQHYLHLRYRKKIQHKEIAKILDFSERQLYRHRKEQIESVARVCIGL
ncbi:MAG: hypothetical protein AAF702_22330 [Chloroflexota bacterium]